MVPALLLATLAGAAPVKLALPGLNGVNLTPQETALYGEVLSQKLIRRGLDVMTARDVEAILGHERQLQLVGCSETSGCLVELAGALGVDGIVVGDVGKAAEGFVVNVKVLATRGSKPVALHNGRAASPEQLRDLLEQAAWEVAFQLSGAFNRPDLKPKDPRPDASGRLDPRWWAVAPAAVAVGGGVVGGLFLSQAAGHYDALAKATTQAQAVQERDAGKQAQLLGWVGVGVGAAAVAATVVMVFTLGPKAPVAPTAVVTPQGASFGLVGVLP